MAEGVYTPDVDSANPNNENGSPMISKCRLIENFTRQNGSGMCNVSGSPTVTCTSFTGNAGEYHGGGMYNDQSASLQLTNCGFFDNVAESFGGAIVNKECPNPSLVNCTLAGNTAERKGGGIYNGLGSFAGGIDSTPLTISNSILWGNSTLDPDLGPQLALEECELFMNDTILDGGEPAVYVLGTVAIHENNVVLADPQFVDGEGRITLSSPAVNAGNDAALDECVSVDLDGNERYVCAVDIGAYEYQGGLLCDTCAGDLDGDGLVTFLDVVGLRDVLVNAGPPYIVEPECDTICGDYDGDGMLTLQDLLALFQDVLAAPGNQLVCP